eukprot:scaffold207_cov267-Pinguiococcus_pyrenoidosus.AAC.9
MSFPSTCTSATAHNLSRRISESAANNSPCEVAKARPKVHSSNKLVATPLHEGGVEQPRFPLGAETTSAAAGVDEVPVTASKVARTQSAAETAAVTAAAESPAIDQSGCDGGDCCVATCSPRDACAQDLTSGREKECLDPDAAEVPKEWLMRVEVEIYPEALEKASVAEILDSVDAGIRNLVEDVVNPEIRSVLVVRETTGIWLSETPTSEIVDAVTDTFQELRCGAFVSVNCSVLAQPRNPGNFRLRTRRLSERQRVEDGEASNPTTELRRRRKALGIDGVNPDTNVHADVPEPPDADDLDDAPPTDPSTDLPGTDAPAPPALEDLPDGPSVEDAEELPSLTVTVETVLNETSSSDLGDHVDMDDLEEVRVEVESGLEQVGVTNQTASAVSDVFVTATTAIGLLEELRGRLEETLALQTSIDGSFDKGNLVVISKLDIDEPRCRRCENHSGGTSDLITTRSLVIAGAAVAFLLVATLLAALLAHRWRSGRRQKDRKFQIAVATLGRYWADAEEGEKRVECAVSEGIELPASPSSELERV